MFENLNPQIVGNGIFRVGSLLGHLQGRLLILYIRIYDIFITYLLRSRETVCFVDPRPPLLLEAKPIVCLIGKQTNQMRSLQTGL
jgi:hypothetical protein